MEKIAVVVQRFGKEVLGGAEHHARIVSEILSKKYFVEVITSCALDHVTWRNHYKAGSENFSKNIVVTRHSVDFERNQKWHTLNGLLHQNVSIESFMSIDSLHRKNMLNKIKNLPLSFSHEWLKRQGPYSSSLLEHIRIKQEEYKYILFFTYLYATTYYGVLEVTDKSKVRIIPTYHDEPEAYIPLFRMYASYKHLFSTNAERKFVESVIYQDTFCADNEVIYYGLKDKPDMVSSSDIDSDYFVYVGRLERNKGVKWLIDMFAVISKTNSYKLVMIGSGVLKGYRSDVVEYVGYVSEERKASLISGAVAMIQPSPFESMSIVLLEAFMNEVPCLVNEYCGVLTEHIIESNGGYAFRDADTLLTALKLISVKTDREKRGKLARKYFCDHYLMKDYENRLLNRVFI